MQQIFIGIVLCLLVGLMACESSEKEYELPGQMPAYYTLVVAKHDTAMLLMGDIERTQRALRKVMPQYEGEQEQQILRALTALKKAEEGMMTWMHEFKSTELNEEEYKALSEEAIQAYLAEEEQKIEQVHVDMSTSIAEGQALLGDLKE